MLKNHCQPCGDQEVLCHATSLHGLLLLIKRSRSLVMVTVITAYSSFIIKAVAECGRLAPSCAVPSQGEQEVAGVCQNRLTTLHCLDELQQNDQPLRLSALVSMGNPLLYRRRRHHEFLRCLLRRDDRPQVSS